MLKNAVTITGHRPHKLPWGQDEGSPSCEMFIAILRIRVLMLIDQGYDTFYTGMSWGTDMLFGELIVKLKKQYPHIKLIGVLPFEDMHTKWHISYQERYTNLIKACNEVVLLNQTYHKNCYKERNKFLIDHSVRLFAVFDGQSLRSDTYQTIVMAKKRGLTITYINPSTLKPKTIRGKPEIRLIK